MEYITYLSALDQSMQPAAIWAAEGDEPRPLVVSLHTWSFGMNPVGMFYIEECKKRNWHCIYPHFRGPNWTPEACGSDLVVSDLTSAVQYMKEHYAVDEKRVFLAGGSGGGHAALLMAGRNPELWSAVSAWCPISDLTEWYKQVNKKKNNPDVVSYDNHIAEACGGDPTTCPQAAAEAEHRSPLTWLKNAKDKLIIDIGTGIHDGHTGSVPVSHAILAYNELANPEDRISQEDIDYMVEKEAVPAHLLFEGEDPAYCTYKVLLRRTSGMVRLTLFEGGHNILVGTSFGFLENQVAGNAPVWYSGDGANLVAEELAK